MSIWESSCQAFASHVQSGRQHAVLAVHRAYRHAQELPHAERHRQQPDVSRSAQRRRIHLVNKNRNRIKLLRKESGGLVIYAMMLDYGRLRLPSVEQGAISRALEWRDLAGMIRHVIEDPNYRLRCLRSGVKIH